MKASFYQQASVVQFWGHFDLLSVTMISGFTYKSNLFDLKL